MGTLKNPTKCLWRWEPDHRSNVLLQSACASMFRHMYDWNIVYCDVSEVENVASISKACRKRWLIWAVCRNHRIKGWSRVGAWTGTLKNPTKCLWRWEPDRRSKLFFSPPAHLRAVTYMTEISLIVTLNSQFNPTQVTNSPHLDMLNLLECYHSGSGFGKMSYDGSRAGQK